MAKLGKQQSHSSPLLEIIVNTGETSIIIDSRHATSSIIGVFFKKKFKYQNLVLASVFQIHYTHGMSYQWAKVWQLIWCVICFSNFSLKKFVVHDGLVLFPYRLLIFFYCGSCTFHPCARQYSHYAYRLFQHLGPLRPLPLDGYFLYITVWRTIASRAGVVTAIVSTPTHDALYNWWS
jgi:hypothetical protein